MSKITGNRNGREARKRRARHRMRNSKSWHRLHVMVVDGEFYTPVRRWIYEALLFMSG